MTAWEQSLSDTLSLVDTLTKLAELKKSDAVGLTDSASKMVSLSKSDAIATTDTTAKLMSISKADNLILLDAFTWSLYTRILYIVMKLTRHLTITSSTKSGLKITSVIKEK